VSRQVPRSVRRAAPLALLTAAVLAAVLIAGGPTRDGPPLDPAGTGPDGTKALVDVLEILGTDVRITDTVDAGHGVALLLVDALGDEAFADLREWVRAGGTLVVADPGSRFAPDIAGAAAIGPLETSLPRECALAALADVQRVTAPRGVVYEQAGADTVGCFPRGAGHWLVARQEQAGTVVALGGPGALTNAALREADNALLAVALLAADHDGSLTFLRPGAPGEGEASLRELIPDEVVLALVQLAIAFGVVVAWRSRRLGAPVREAQPVQVAGSELVTAVGHLLQRTGARGQAARLLREDLRRQLAERLGLPADSSPDVVAAAAARRTGRPSDALTSLLSGGDPAADGELVALSADLERARHAALDPNLDPTFDPTRHPMPDKEPTRVH